MSFNNWERKILDAPGASERVAEIENELRLAASLTDLREQAGLTQRELAKRLGVSQPRVAAIEKASNVTIDVLGQFVDAIGGQLEVSVRRGNQLVHLIGVGLVERTTKRASRLQGGSLPAEWAKDSGTAMKGTPEEQPSLKGLLTKVEALCKSQTEDFADFWLDANINIEGRDLVEELAVRLNRPHCVARLCWLRRISTSKPTSGAADYMDQLISDFYAGTAADALYEASHITFNAARSEFESPTEFLEVLDRITRAHMMKMASAGLQGYIKLVSLMDQREADAVTELLVPRLDAFDERMQVVWFISGLTSPRGDVEARALGALDESELGRLFSVPNTDTVERSNSRMRLAVGRCVQRQPAKRATSARPQ